MTTTPLLLSLTLLLLCLHVSDCFVTPLYSSFKRISTTTTTLAAQRQHASRRTLFQVFVASASLPLITNTHSALADFAPGGTLVDYPVGVQVGNSEASPSRASDNANVLFKQDYYFKFGTAAPFIPPADFPKTMPFVPSQQRYDALKKYKNRIVRGIDTLQSLDTTVEEIPDPTTLDVYQLRPMGLLANNFMASENTGTTNELLLARYYINEVYLDIGDMRTASTGKEKKQAWIKAKKALNSYLGLLNQSINQKVGDKFDLLSV